MEEFTSLLSINSVGMLRNFIGVAVIVGSIVVFMAMYTAVLERTREIGILKAVGDSSSLWWTTITGCDSASSCKWSGSSARR